MILLIENDDILKGKFKSLNISLSELFYGNCDDPLLVFCELVSIQKPGRFTRKEDKFLVQNWRQGTNKTKFMKIIESKGMTIF